MPILQNGMLPFHTQQKGSQNLARFRSTPFLCAIEAPATSTRWEPTGLPVQKVGSQTRTMPSSDFLICSGRLPLRKKKSQTDTKAIVPTVRNVSGHCLSFTCSRTADN